MKYNGEKYKLLAKIIPDVVYEFDSDGKFTFVSDSIREFGYNPKYNLEEGLKETIGSFRQLGYMSGLTGRNE